jgi:hypothetical protein
VLISVVAVAAINPIVVSFSIIKRNIYIFDFRFLLVWLFVQIH